jgi:(1->4)-alpha-D-glucan 1-alpha-D-glucosylmutase
VAAEPEQTLRATYRVQFRRDFGFARARDLVDYWSRLGISDLYASPLFQARVESTHGYDVVDPRRLDPRFGPESDFDEMAAALAHAEMGLMLDIVPNHMAASPANPWFRDVLEKGSRSPFARFFDIDWSEPTLLPVLGEPLEEAVENGRVTLELTEKGLAVRYLDKSFPLDPASYDEILPGAGEAANGLAEDEPTRTELARLLDRLAALPPSTEVADPETDAPGARREAVKRRLLELYRSRRALRETVDERIAEFNATSEDPNRLMALLERQAYRLAFWREASRSLNYRRFFNISDLIGVRVEDPDVFEATHARVLSLAGEGRVTALRIDHIDGLYDPEGYLRRLQNRVAAARGIPGPFPIVVEKILSPAERLPPPWPIAGTTGYQFAGEVHAVFLDGEGLEQIRRAYRRATGFGARRADVAYEEKRRIVRSRLQSETRSLARRLQELPPDATPGTALDLADLADALVEVTASLPVYRTYVRDPTPEDADLCWILRALGEARRRSPGLKALDVLGRILQLQFPPGLPTDRRREWLDFVQRWQQYTGPAMAKGVEDTAFYLDNALVSLNEVGSVGAALSTDEFHRRQRERLRAWPGGLSATSTHDTKRSEDVRARIGVLTELAEDWSRRALLWSRWNDCRKTRVGGVAAPGPSEETMLYQNLLGAWPLEEREVPAFRRRFQAFLIKALREAKVHTRWAEPNHEYEHAVASFADSIVEPSPENRFLQDFLPFQARLAAAGALVSLAQTLVKIAAPGVADFYQGTELWDFSLVDPDNRRPVDFALRRRLLEELDGEEAVDREGLVSRLRAGWRDGRVKLYLISRGLRGRRNDPELFVRGDYIPLEASPESPPLLAFARRRAGRWLLAVCPRHWSRGLDPEHPLGPFGRVPGWLPLPAGAPTSWTDLLSGRVLTCSLRAGAPSLAVRDLLDAFPLGLLTGGRGTPRRLEARS